MSTKLAASFYATLSITFWGISFVSTKAVLDKLDPYTVLVIRFGFGALFLLSVLVFMRYPMKLALIHVPALIVLGILGVFVHQIIQATALLTIDASHAGWIISFSPVFTVFLSMIFLHEKVTLSRAIGIGVAIAGVILITTSRSGQGISFAMNIGYLLMLLSTLNWAVYGILLKRLHIPLPSIVITFYMSALSFILTVPILIKGRGWEDLALLSPGEWGHLIFLGVFVSGIAYWYWGKAHEVLEASQASAFMYLEPLATLIAAVLLLNERIFLQSIAGGIIIIVGVIFVNGQVWNLRNILKKRRV
ncbi:MULTISPECIES: DMT family transporter [Pontibacillus]|uniref:DMT family transporter n=1 Tax=Pontibacillus chungwhensis TaxID=265426 RepID=A0ABY8UY32_9BACI|nr:MULTISPECIES: DMT family transporter [Pontibacillus]MCD5323179.1 DMT family transporter [Pontibacillus sp. HN14]WIF96566.1 DMT family transporter [Pontibacillus chungwhensis]